MDDTSAHIHGYAEILAMVPLPARIGAIYSWTVADEMAFIKARRTTDQMEAINKTRFNFGMSPISETQWREWYINGILHGERRWDSTMKLGELRRRVAEGAK